MSFCCLVQLVGSFSGGFNNQASSEEDVFSFGAGYNLACQWQCGFKPIFFLNFHSRYDKHCHKIIRWISIALDLFLCHRHVKNLAQADYNSSVILYCQISSQHDVLEDMKSCS